MLSHVLDEVGRLLSVGQLFGQGKPRFNGRGGGQVILAEVPPAFGRVRLDGRVARRRWRRRRHRVPAKKTSFKTTGFKQKRRSGSRTESRGLGFSSSSSFWTHLPGPNSAKCFSPKARKFKSPKLKLTPSGTIFSASRRRSSPAMPTSQSSPSRKRSFRSKFGQKVPKTRIKPRTCVDFSFS